MDYLHRFLKYIDYNRYTVLALLLAAAVIAPILALTGCQVTTQSLISPPMQVTPLELEAEVKTLEAALDVKRADIKAEAAVLNAKIELANADIEQKIALQSAVVGFVEYVAVQTATGGLNPAMLIPGAIGLFGMFYGLGKKADNKRKDSVIATIRAVTVPTGGTPNA